MPKMKTRSGIKARFKKTGSGMKSGRKGMRHNLSPRSTKHKRRKRSNVLACDAVVATLKVFAPHVIKRKKASEKKKENDNA